MPHNQSQPDHITEREAVIVVTGRRRARVEVPVEDAAALTDVDTPEALVAVRAAMDAV